MTPKEAASVIGCTTRHVRTLIARGTLPAEPRDRVALDGRVFGVVYYLRAADVRRYAAKEQTVGYPRGRKRGGAK